jgi:hypothetical protein
VVLIQSIAVALLMACGSDMSGTRVGTETTLAATVVAAEDGRDLQAKVTLRSASFRPDSLMLGGPLAQLEAVTDAAGHFTLGFNPDDFSPGDTAPDSLLLEVLSADSSYGLWTSLAPTESAPDPLQLAFAGSLSITGMQDLADTTRLFLGFPGTPYYSEFTGGGQHIFSAIPHGTHTLQLLVLDSAKTVMAEAFIEGVPVALTAPRDIASPLFLPLDQMLAAMEVAGATCNFSMNGNGGLMLDQAQQPLCTPRLQ